MPLFDNFFYSRWEVQISLKVIYGLWIVKREQSPIILTNTEVIFQAKMCKVVISLLTIKNFSCSCLNHWNLNRILDCWIVLDCWSDKISSEGVNLECWNLLSLLTFYSLNLKTNEEMTCVEMKHSYSPAFLFIKKKDLTFLLNKVKYQ